MLPDRGSKFGAFLESLLHKFDQKANKRGKDQKRGIEAVRQFPIHEFKAKKRELKNLSSRCGFD